MLKLNLVTFIPIQNNSPPLPPNKPQRIKLLACTCVSAMLLPGEVYETVLRFAANVSPHKNGIVFFGIAGFEIVILYILCMK